MHGTLNTATHCEAPAHSPLTVQAVSAIYAFTISHTLTCMSWLSGISATGNHAQLMQTSADTVVVHTSAVCWRNGYALTRSAFLGRVDYLSPDP